MTVEKETTGINALVKERQYQVYRKQKILETEKSHNRALHESIAKRKKLLVFLIATRMDMESELRLLESEGL